MTSLPTPRDIPVVASGVEHLCPGQVVITLYQSRPSSLDLLLGSSRGNVVSLVLPYAFLTFTERASLVIHPASSCMQEIALGAASNSPTEPEGRRPDLCLCLPLRGGSYLWSTVEPVPGDLYYLPQVTQPVHNPTCDPLTYPLCGHTCTQRAFC